VTRNWRAFWTGFTSIWDLSGQRGARELEAAAERRRREADRIHPLWWNDWGCEEDRVYDDL